MRLPGCNLYRYAIAQQLVGAQIGLIQGDAGGVGGSQELLQRSRNVRIGITTLLKEGLIKSTKLPPEALT